MRCPNYTGVACVNGNCPNALADEFPEYGYQHLTCEECGCYKGCDDCCFSYNGKCRINKSECTSAN